MDNLDQFYTNNDVVDICLQSINFSDYDLTIEPSAGMGNFYNKIPISKIGIDLDPKQDDMIEQDYLDYIYTGDAGNILVLGNPPFGKNSSLAIKFFNKSAEFADTIAFILPRTFRKKSVINKLNNNFHNIYESILPPNSFYTPDGNIVDVPCVWQVWKKRIEKREKIIILYEHKDFSFVDRKEDANFLLQRVGANAGSTHKNFNKSASSHYLIKADERVYEIFNKVDWSTTPKYDTAGNPSLSKDDIINAYNKIRD